MCANKCNVPGCEYQLQAEAPLKPLRGASTHLAFDVDVRWEPCCISYEIQNAHEKNASGGEYFHVNKWIVKQHNVPGCEYQVQVEVTSGGLRRTWHLMLLFHKSHNQAHPLPWPAEQRQWGEKHFICEMIHVKLHDQLKTKRTSPGPPTILTCDPGQFLQESGPGPPTTLTCGARWHFCKGNGQKHCICEMISYEMCVQI